jgi:energy-coupling factor transport system ATP-binding protein
MTVPLISLRDAGVTYGAAAPVLDGVSLDVAPRSWTALAGANGSGKSTLLAALAGLAPLCAGRRECGARRVAMLMQDPDDQFVASSVAHELALSVDPDAPGREARIAESIRRFALETLLARSPHRLSGGEKQRLAMATVWLEDPDVLLLDEPLAYLDDANRALVTGFVRELNQGGAAVVWATPGDDLALAQDAIVLAGGRIAYRGSAAGAPVTAPAAPALASREPAPPPAGPALALEGVTFGYGGATVLFGVDLRVAAGECVGVFGPNSAGKSTLLLVAGGALAPFSGRVTRPPGFALYLPQSPERLFFAETLREEIAFGLKRRGLAPRAIAERAEESLRAAGLEPDVFLERSPFQLSFGEMRRAAFAIAESLAPDLLLLDEPASCLDADGRLALRSLVGRRLDAGGAVVVASHDLAHLQELSGRIVSLTRDKGGA